MAVTAKGVTSLTFNNGVAADAAYLPLSNKGRIVVNTGIGDTIDVERIVVLQED